MKKRILSILLTLVMVIGMLPTVAHAAVGEIVPITDEELLEVMEVDLRIGNEIIASSESTSFSNMSNPGHWELKLSKRDNANRMEYYIVLHLYNYNVPSGYIDFMYDMKSSADPMNSVSFQVSVHGDCQVGFISASTTDKERVYGSSLDIIFAAGATLRTKQINHRGTGQWDSDIELNLEGTPGEKPGILYTKEIANSYYLIDWPHGSELVTYANNLIIINYDTPTNGTLFRTDEDKCTYKVQFGERVDLFLNTGHGQFPIFGEYADETLAQKYQYIEDDGITAFSDLRAHLWFKESGDPADEYTVGDSIDYYFFPELSMLDFLFKAGINEQFKGDTTSGFKVESSYELTNLSRSTKVASGTVAGVEEAYSDENFVKVAGKNGEEYFTFETSGIYELRATVKLIHNGNVVDSVGKVYHFLVNDKPLVTPTITQQPEDVANATGDVTLTAKADNATRARWYVEKSDGTVAALGDAFTDGTSTQTISKASNAVGNRYFCAFWSEDDKIAKTDSVTVCFVPTVTPNGDVNVDSGNTAFLKVTESGCGHYAAANGWYKDGVELTSGDKYYIMGTTLAVQNAAAADAGTYTYKYVTEHGDEVTADVTLTVNTGSSSTTIDTFDITGLDNPVILGTVADTSVSVPTGANYTVESVTWTAGVNGSGVVTGSSGMVSIKLKAKDGYTFKSGDLAGTVEGIYKTVYSVPANATEITVNVDYNNYSSWKIAYPANDTISISTDSLTFKVGTAANGQKVEGAFNCTHSGLADTNLHHTGMKYAVYSIADNAMPAGLTLNADGTITGTPTTAGVYTVMVRADSVNASGTASNCSGLAVKAIEIIVESDAHTHDWDIENPVEVTPANCTTDGTSKITCKDTSCNESVEITVPATGHNWGEWNNGAPIITPRCTDANDLVIYRTCNNANCPVGTESKTISRIHMAMDWTTDETHHWKVCGYCEEEVMVAPVAHADSDSDNKCDTCQYDMTSAVQPFVDMIVISDVIAPEAGTDASIAPNYVVDSTRNYTVEKAEWWMNDSDSKATEFVAGTNYRAVFTVVPKEGVVFDNPLKVKINGNDATVISSSDDKAVVSISLTATGASVETPFVDMIEISDVIAPEAGTDASIAPNYVVDSTRNYTVEKAEWWMNDSDSKATEFVAGTNYRAVFTVVPKEGVVFDDPLKVKINGNDATVISSSEDKAVVSISLTAVKDANTGGSGGGGGSVATYAIVVEDSDNGEISASKKYASKGTDITLTVKADEGYELDTLKVLDKNGDKVKVTKKGDKYTFEMPASKVTVEATFSKIEVEPTFDDVAEDAYYFDAVEWAVEEGITSGTSATTFSPNATCTRAQAVTFLWRAAGSPEPKSTEMPFEDVAADAYYYDAVLWAVENGITAGTSATTFSPNNDCTRAQIVTFLWRSEKSPAADSVNPFTDVAAEAYYFDAVLWAVENGVTAGTTATTFSPNNDCTRAQIVTFLYRALGK